MMTSHYSESRIFVQKSNFFPCSAIPFAMKDQFVPSYLSTNGTFGSVSSDEWKSYLPMPNYPEYPSATTAICYAHAEAMRRLLGSDYLKWSIEMSKFEF